MYDQYAINVRARNAAGDNAPRERVLDRDEWMSSNADRYRAEFRRTPENNKRQRREARPAGIDRTAEPDFTPEPPKDRNGRTFDESLDADYQKYVREYRGQDGERPLRREIWEAQQIGDVIEVGRPGMFGQRYERIESRKEMLRRLWEADRNEWLREQAQERRQVVPDTGEEDVLPEGMGSGMGQQPRTGETTQQYLDRQYREQYLDAPRDPAARVLSRDEWLDQPVRTEGRREGVPLTRRQILGERMLRAMEMQSDEENREGRNVPDVRSPERIRQTPEVIDRDSRRGRRNVEANRRMEEAQQRFQTEQRNIDDHFATSDDTIQIYGDMSDEDRDMVGLPRRGERPFEFLMRRWMEDEGKGDKTFEDWLDEPSSPGGKTRRQAELDRYASANGKPRRTRDRALPAGDGRALPAAGREDRNQQNQQPALPAGAPRQPSATPQRSEAPTPAPEGRRWRDVTSWSDFVDEKYGEYEDRVDAMRARGDDVALVPKEEWLGANAASLAREYDSEAPEDRLPKSDAGRRETTGAAGRSRRTGSSDARAQETASRRRRASDVPMGEAVPQDGSDTDVTARQMGGETSEALRAAGFDVMARVDEDQMMYRRMSPSEQRDARVNDRMLSDEQLYSPEMERVAEQQRQALKRHNDAVRALEQAVSEGREEDYEDLVNELVAAKRGVDPGLNALGILEERRRRDGVAQERRQQEEAEREAAKPENRLRRARQDVNMQKTILRQQEEEAAQNADRLAQLRGEAEPLREWVAQLDDAVSKAQEEFRRADELLRQLQQAGASQTDLNDAVDAKYEATGAIGSAMTARDRAQSTLDGLDRDIMSLSRAEREAEESRRAIAETEAEIAAIESELGIQPGSSSGSLDDMIAEDLRTRTPGTSRPQGSARTRTASPVERTPPVSPPEPSTPEAVEPQPEPPSGPRLAFPDRQLNKLVDRHDETLSHLVAPGSQPYQPVPMPPGGLGPDELAALPLSEVPDDELVAEMMRRGTPARGTDSLVQQYKSKLEASGMNAADVAQAVFDFGVELEELLWHKVGDPTYVLSDALRTMLLEAKAAGRPFIEHQPGTASGPRLMYLISDDGTLDGRGYIIKPPDLTPGRMPSQHAEALGTSLAQRWGYAAADGRIVRATLDGQSEVVIVTPLGSNMANRQLSEYSASGGFLANPVQAGNQKGAGDTEENAESRLGISILNGMLATHDRHTGNAMGFADNGSLPIDFGRAFRYKIDTPEEFGRYIEFEIMGRSLMFSGSDVMDPDPMAGFAAMFDRLVAEGMSDDEALALVRQRLEAALNFWADSTEQMLDDGVESQIRQRISSLGVANPRRMGGAFSDVRERETLMRRRIAILRNSEFVDYLMNTMYGVYYGDPDRTRITYVDGATDY